MNTSTLSPRIVKIRQVSSAFCIICRVLLALSVLAGVGLVIPYFLLQRSPAQAPGVYEIGNLMVGLITFTYWASGLWMLERLFNTLLTGPVFDPNSGRWLKRFGFWVMTSLLVPIGLRMALDLAVFGRLGAIAEGPFTPVVGAFFVGLFVMMLGWILEEGSELQAEQDLTV